MWGHILWAADAVVKCNKPMQMLQSQLVPCMQIERLPVFFKQRDNYFFPAWTFVIPTTIMRLPVSFVESLVWTVITYFEIDLAPTAGRYWCSRLVSLDALLSLPQVALEA